MSYSKGAASARVPLYRAVGTDIMPKLAKRFIRGGVNQWVMNNLPEMEHCHPRYRLVFSVLCTIGPEMKIHRQSGVVCSKRDPPRPDHVILVLGYASILTQDDCEQMSVPCLHI